MGATLAETLAEIDAEAAAQQSAPVPPRVAPPRAAPAAKPKATPAKEGAFTKIGRALNTAQRAITPGSPESLKLSESVAAGVVRAPGQFVGGMFDSMGDAGRFVSDNISPEFTRKVGVTLATYGGPGKTLANVQGASMVMRQGGASLADTLSARKTLGQVGYPGVNQFVTEGIATTAPMVVTGGAGIAPRIAAAAVGGAIGMEGKDLKDRAKNAAIAGALEVGGEAVIGGVKMLAKSIKQATPTEAATDALDRAFATKRTEDARYAAAEAQTKGEPLEPSPQEELPVGTRKGDAGEPSLTDDANHALEVSGSPERIDVAAGPELSPTGKILVSPEAKAAVDDAGYGRAFAAKVEGMEPDAVIFKEVDELGGQRVVGSMPVNDLQALSDDVARLMEDPASINLKAPGEHGQWTMTQLGASYDTAAVLRAIVERVPGNTTKMTDKLVMEQASAAASVLGQSTDDALAFARSVAGDQTDATVALKTVQTIWTKMGDELSAFMDTPWATAGDDVVEAAMAKVHNLQMFSMAMEEAKAGAGRALRTLSLPDADTYLAAARRAAKDPSAKPAPLAPDNPPPLPRTREELDQWLQMWDALKDNPQGQAAFLKGIREYPSGSLYLRTSFANFFTGSILSAPKTILMNVFGPAVMGGLRTLERTSGAAFNAVNPLLSKAERAGALAAAQAAPTAYIQTLADIGDAFKFAAASIRQEGRQVLGGANPVDLGSGTLFVPEPMIKAAQADGKSGKIYHLGNLINYWPRAVWAMHGTTNEFATLLAYRGEVRAAAMMEAHELGLKGPDWQAHVTKRVTDSIDNSDGAAMNAQALDEANRTTMTRATNEEYNKGAASVVSTVQKWRQQVPELRYVLPVFQVPANALGETLRRLPGINFLLRETRQELSGTLGPMRQAEAYGRMQLGAGLLVGGAILARQGILTGAGPQDPTDRRVWLETHQPYSMRVGDQWVAYDKMDPAGPLLALTAGYFDHSVYKGTDQDMTLAAVGALAQYFKDKAAVQGIADLLNFGGDPRDQATLTRRASSVVKGFIPAFVNVARVANDGDLRVKRNTWDYIRDALPGVSTSLDPVRNILGENVHKPQDTVTEAMLPVTLSPVNTYAKDPVLDEIDRLYQKTGYTPGLLSPAFGGQARYDMRDAKLENGYSLYDAMMKARLTATVDGLTLREALNELINSTEYNDSVDGTGKVQDSDSEAFDSRGGMVQRVFTTYNKAAKAEVAASSTMARKWIATSQAKTQHNDQLRGVALPDLVKNPALLDSLGIDISSYEEALAQ